MEAAQPQVASDKEQMALLSTYQDAHSEGVLNCWVNMWHNIPYQEPIET